MKPVRIVGLTFLAAFAVAALWVIGSYRQDSRRHVPILIYHYFRSAQYPRPLIQPGLASYYIVSEAEFEQQLDYLERNGYHTITFSRLCLARSYRELPSKPIVLTVDHEAMDRMQIAVPALVRHGMTATFFVTTGWLTRPGTLNDEDLRSIVGAGMEVQSHSQMHSLLDSGTREHVRRELVDSRKYLVNALGLPVLSFSPPGGRYSQMTIDEAKSLQFVGFRSTDPGFGHVGDFVQHAITLPGRLSEQEFSALLTPEGIATNYLLGKTEALARGLLGSHYLGFRMILIRFGVDRLVLSPIARIWFFGILFAVVLVAAFPRRLLRRWKR